MGTLKYIKKLGYNSEVKILKREENSVFLHSEKKKIICVANFYEEIFSCKIEGQNLQIEVKKKKIRWINIDMEGKILEIVE